MCIRPWHSTSMISQSRYQPSTPCRLAPYERTSGIGLKCGGPTWFLIWSERGSATLRGGQDSADQSPRLVLRKRDVLEGLTRLRVVKSVQESALSGSLENPAGRRNQPALTADLVIREACRIDAGQPARAAGPPSLYHSATLLGCGPLKAETQVRIP